MSAKQTAKTKTTTANRKNNSRRTKWHELNSKKLLISEVFGRVDLPLNLLKQGVAIFAGPFGGREAGGEQGYFWTPASRRKVTWNICPACRGISYLVGARAQFCPWCQTPLAIENAQEQAISQLRKQAGYQRPRKHQ